jgi:tetratricopeptide (TPR) repeat protein
MELEPDYLFARVSHVILLEFTGPFDQAVAEAREVLRRDRLSMQATTELGRTLFFNRQFREAAGQLSLTIERDSTQYRAHMTLGEVLEQLGKPDSAVLEMQAAVRHAPASSRAHAFLAYAYARAGRTGEARRELRLLEDKRKKSYVPAFDFAVANLGLDRMDEVFASLWQAIDEHSLRPYVMAPTFDPIRSDPRYAQLMARLHLKRAPKPG